MSQIKYQNNFPIHFRIKVKFISFKIVPDFKDVVNSNSLSLLTPFKTNSLIVTGKAITRNFIYNFAIYINRLELKSYL